MRIKADGIHRNNAFPSIEIGSTERTDMKIKEIAFIMLLFIPFSAYGDEKEQLAKELMELTNMGQMIEQVNVQAKQMGQDIMAQFDIPEDQKEKAAEFQGRLYDKIFETMSFKEMENEYIELFTSVYTVEELKGIVDFYKSPVGKSLIKKQPMIIQRAMAISQNKMSVLLPEIEKMAKEFSSTLKEE